MNPIKKYPIPIEGVLCKGMHITIGWPEPEEFDFITTLRNKESIRKWFYNNSEIGLVQNRKWLADKTQRPESSLLSIRSIETGLFLGTIGWTNWDLNTRTADFGRIAIDGEMVRKSFNSKEINIAVDASRSIRDFAFREMMLLTARTSYFEENHNAKVLNEKIGMRIVGRKFILDSSGIKQLAVFLEISLQEWKNRLLEERK